MNQYFSDVESGDDDQRHTTIIRREKRGGQTEAGSEFEAEFEKFYAEEKVDIVDASDEVVIKPRCHLLFMLGFFCRALHF